jgi:hypothetical protein
MSNFRSNQATKYTAGQQAAMYYMRKKNRMGRPKLDTAPLDSAAAIEDFGGTPTATATAVAAEAESEE